MKDAKIFNIPIVVIPERSSFSAWCPDLDVASQGDTVEEAIANIKEAIELHVECLTPMELIELKSRTGKELMTTVEVSLA